ncbi:hypothetical protein IAR55_006211 [Kwoniella newhampshirensis]|uniref:Proteasome assembly chaperone 2 n=1 Tax=Kwoniella newhampshirensis TaxID=1651941 RepID=A0AAW0YU53_9TREE
MTTFYPAQTFDAGSFNGSTLILPAVSLGNVPQLTADLLVASLGLRRVGWIGKGDTVAPFAGAGEDGEIVTGGLEVYGQPGSEVYVVQQRSPTLKTKKDAHVALLHDFITANSFSSVMILTSLDAANQDDAQLLTPHQRVLPPHLPSSPPPPIQRLSDLFPPLNLNIDESAHSSFPSSSATAPYPPFLPAAGLTRRLLSSLASENIAHGAVTAWCVEGDNRGDAIALAGVVLQTLGIENDVQLQEPSSWEGLFGTTEGWSGGMGADSELYG